MDSSFTNVGNNLRIYLTLMVTSCNGKRSFFKLKIIEWTKQHNRTKQARWCKRFAALQSTSSLRHLYWDYTV